MELLALLVTLGALVDVSARSIHIQGRQLLVDGVPIHLKGVCWNPVRKGGTHPKDLDFRGFVESDSALMAKAGINAVRTYDTITDTEVLDILWKRGINVLNTVYIFGGDAVESVTDKVRKVRDHPAILMWVVGNEWNYNGLYVGLPFDQSLDKVLQATRLIKDNDPHHPVATVYGERPDKRTLERLADIDVWGINKYSGLTFGDLFNVWSGISGKPMFLGEYGADAYDSRFSRVDEEAQAKATTVLTQEIMRASSVNGGVCIGGIIFEFADEWWKDGSGNPDRQDVGGVSPGGGPYPDMTFNEEWWGLLQYDGTPRRSFVAYANIDIPTAPGALSATPRLPPTPSGRPGREGSCGAFSGCKGKIGFCCPSSSGSFDDCCAQPPSSTAEPTPAPMPSTTWRPSPCAPAATSQVGPALWAYVEQSGKFANGHFRVGTNGCLGVGECQFRTRQEAQAFCDTVPECTAVLLHPFADNCAGGFGCYTPRFGAINPNTLWERSGGKGWIKTTAPPTPLATQQDSGSDCHNSRYVLIGFAPAIEAVDACRPYGQLVMPKTADEQAEVRRVLDEAQAAGKLSKTWPQNTIWLGGIWEPVAQRWEWLDESPITQFNWAPGQPSSTSDQAKETRLCMVLDGAMHDSDPPYSFGVLCEMSDSVLATAPASQATTATTTPVVSTTVAPPASPVTPAAGSAAPTPPILSIFPPSLQDVDSASFTTSPPQALTSHYSFIGFAGPTEARGACGVGGELPAPKSESEWRELMMVLGEMVKAGKLSETWPADTIWLGAHWNETLSLWQWEDGTPANGLRWGDGQPSASDDQTREPWLCLTLDGQVHDSETPFAFGVLCNSAGGAPPVTLPWPPSTHRSTPSPTEEWHPSLGVSTFGNYEFAGFGSPEQARTMCPSGKQLAMPKTQSQMHALKVAVSAAMDAGRMNETWPYNTIWLGGHWNANLARWEWDDGIAVIGVHWGDGQPSAADDQSREPWLCMIPSGDVHDSDPPYLFGVMCEPKRSRWEDVTESRNLLPYEHPLVA